ncbi:unnamed protein product [Amoebophrya sp. A25]|nr:unnamed protein product [Amoebophrya sp. A25]|eukprot:GSA25T00026997001.1
MFFWRKARPPTPLPGFMRKVKVCCTIGPSCDSAETLDKMVAEGMNIARFNLSHENSAIHKAAIQNVRKVTEASSRTNPVGVVLDTRGKEIRTTSRPAALDLLEGQKVQLLSARKNYQIGGSSSSSASTTSTSSGGNNSSSIGATDGSPPTIVLKYPEIETLLHPGHTIRMQDGEIQLRVLNVDPRSGLLECEVLFDATLGADAKNVHFPEDVELPATEILKPEDTQDLDMLAPFADGILLSFAETAKEVDLVRHRYPGKEIVSKIESVKGLKNLEDIIDLSDGIMVARGDLGMAIEEALHSVQKYIISKCNDVGCPVWVATQMLESMKTSRKATVAELSDISNAVLDGADTLMLSGETAVGDYPVDAVRTLSKTAYDAQQQIELASQKKLQLEVNEHYQRTHRRLYKGLIKPRLCKQLGTAEERQQESLSTTTAAAQMERTKSAAGEDLFIRNKDVRAKLQADSEENAAYEQIGGSSTSQQMRSSTADDALIEEIIVRNATQIANDANCKLIMCITESGLTASLLAKYRPTALVLMLTDNVETQKKFLQVRGIRPVLVENCGKLSEQLLSYYDSKNRDSLEYVRQSSGAMIDVFETEGLKFARDANLVQPRDKVLLLRSMPAGYDQILKILQV